MSQQQSQSQPSAPAVPSESLTLVDVQDFVATGLGVGNVAVRTFDLADGSRMVATFARIPSIAECARKVAAMHGQDSRQGDASRYTGSIRLANLDAVDGLIAAGETPLKVGATIALRDETPQGIAAARRAARNTAVRQARMAGARVLESATAAVQPTPPSKPTRAALKAAFQAGVMDADTFAARYAEATE